MLKPKFLTEKIAKKAIMMVKEFFLKNSSQFLIIWRGDMHIIVMVPSLVDDNRQYPDYYLEPIVLCEESFGKKKEWRHRFDEIAQCKALQLWHQRNNGHLTTPVHLLFPDDTPYYGGVDREGIVVACSGLQPYFDKMISGMVADLCIALAHDDWEKSEDKAKGNDFLSK
ncbi:hypothetical protein A2995_01340 [Candidatus Nomurabacteria bacterium RIFCSPLOWO2_01_FULL_33_24]|uniref:Uncharacterized protein n=1 Tax=Candidatus Nomurabacteria bacterium RIFCSPLOWO2_01_FULL_33_24 TaxID=1801765 RepID=A0A1F6X0V0_9BACT|nr:MAG: hypothetical protein A2995_01340 [Candidatus Nomurabacteria bacterium RIFCSPLOWO2_01_FULL_33_24]